MSEQQGGETVVGDPRCVLATMVVGVFGVGGGGAMCSSLYLYLSSISLSRSIYLTAFLFLNLSTQPKGKAKAKNALQRAAAAAAKSSGKDKGAAAAGKQGAGTDGSPAAKDGESKDSPASLRSLGVSFKRQHVGMRYRRFKGTVQEFLEKYIQHSLGFVLFVPSFCSLHRFVEI